MQKNHSKYILVTGGGGYIGSHTCKMLRLQGYEPVTFDHFINGHKHAVKWGPLFEGDLRDSASVYAVFDKYNFSAVLHFANVADTMESMHDPEKYYVNNVTGTLNLLSAMRKNKVHNLVFSSSCAVYGSTDLAQIMEKTPRNPISTYGRTKTMIETILEDFSLAYGLRYTACRYFNACGADPELEIGEEHTPETHIIPLALMVAAKQRDSFSIFGTDYPTTDGTCIRDYIHVQDLALAHIAALRYLENDGQSDAFNIGTGNGFSVKEVLDTIQRVTGEVIPILNKGRRPGDAPILVASAKKSMSVLGFRPSMSDLDTIIQTAWDFYLKRTTSW